MTELSIQLSRKPAPDEERAFDPQKAAHFQKPKTAAEVEAQCGSGNYQIIICSQCWAVNEVHVDPRSWCGYGICWNCGALLWP